MKIRIRAFLKRWLISDDDKPDGFVNMKLSDGADYLVARSLLDMAKDMISENENGTE